MAVEIEVVRDSDSARGIMENGLAYVIAHVNVTDEEAMKPYRRAMLPTVLDAGGRILAAGGAAWLERPPSVPTTSVIIEFRSLGAAEAWYWSADYQALVPQRIAATESASVGIVAGLPRLPQHQTSHSLP